MADLGEVEAAAMARATQAAKTGDSLPSAALLVLSAVERLVSSAE